MYSYVLMLEKLKINDLCFLPNLVQVHICVFSLNLLQHSIRCVSF